MKWTLLVLALPLLFAGCVWLLQDHLVFFPQPLVSSAHLPSNAVPLEVIAQDGTHLRGWIRIAARTPAPLVLYFGGNAEEVSWTIAERRWPDAWSVAAVNYRGYGRSGGKPGEEALRGDALAFHDAVSSRSDVLDSRIAVVGRSLGTGVAITVAAERRVERIVLASPYDSLVAVGEGHYPWLPVRMLLRHRFDVLDMARTVRLPLLAVVAEHDSIIPTARSRALYDAWRAPKAWRVIAGTDHNTLTLPDAFWAEIEAFLAQ